MNDPRLIASEPYFDTLAMQGAQIAASRANRKDTPMTTDAEALDQIAAALGLYHTDPSNNPVDELLATITANVQQTGRSTNVPQGA